MSTAGDRVQSTGVPHQVHVEAGARHERWGLHLDELTRHEKAPQLREEPGAFS